MRAKAISIGVVFTLSLFLSGTAFAQAKQCYAKAYPEKGNMGGIAWAQDIQTARNDAINACRKNNNYPHNDNSKTCKVTEQKCNIKK